MGRLNKRKIKYFVDQALHVSRSLQEHIVPFFGKRFSGDEYMRDLLVSNLDQIWVDMQFVWQLGRTNFAKACIMHLPSERTFSRLRRVGRTVSGGICLVPFVPCPCPGFI